MTINRYMPSRPLLLDSFPQPAFGTPLLQYCPPPLSSSIGACSPVRPQRHRTAAAQHSKQLLNLRTPCCSRRPGPHGEQAPAPAGAPTPERAGLRRAGEAAHAARPPAPPRVRPQTPRREKPRAAGLEQWRGASPPSPSPSQQWRGAGSFSFSLPVSTMAGARAAGRRPCLARAAQKSGAGRRWPAYLPGGGPGPGSGYWGRPRRVWARASKPDPPLGESAELGL